jgi:hypothetical protein
MAVMVLKDAFVSINSVNLSSYVTDVTLNYEAEIKDITAMGATSKAKIAGLKNASIDITFNQDFGASAVDATLFSLVGGSAVTVEVRPTSGSRSATNPGFTGSGIVVSYTPVAGRVGDVASTKVKIEITGDLTRATS